MGAPAACACTGTLRERGASHQVRHRDVEFVSTIWATWKHVHQGAPPDLASVIRRKENAARGSTVDADYLFALSLAQQVNGPPRAAQQGVFLLRGEHGCTVCWQRHRNRSVSVRRCRCPGAATCPRYSSCSSIGCAPFRCNIGISSSSCCSVPCSRPIARPCRGHPG
jgi:hypothetical protein